MSFSTPPVVTELLAWFEREGRDWPWRRTRDRWVVLVSEVCLQQTQVGRAAGHVERILERYPTPADLAIAPLADLLVLWSGLGYPRRARSLHLAARQIASDGWPDDYRTLPGVGPYTDAALRCFADGEAVVPPDINTRRVLARLFPAGPPSADCVPALRTHAWEWGQAVMELGQRVCRARALCDACPLLARCPSAGTNEVIASAPQSKYEGSLRQRRGNLLRTLTTAGEAQFEYDEAAACSLVEDGLARRSADGSLLLPPAD